MNRSTMNSMSVLARAVNRIETPTRITLRIIIFRRPITSDKGASSIAPAIIPASAKLKMIPSKSGVSRNSLATGVATIAIAVMSKPSSIFRNMQSPTTRNCWRLAGPLSMTSETRSVLSIGALDCTIRVFFRFCGYFINHSMEGKLQLAEPAPSTLAWNESPG